MSVASVLGYTAAFIRFSVLFSRKTTGEALVKIPGAADNLLQIRMRGSPTQATCGQHPTEPLRNSFEDCSDELYVPSRRFARGIAGNLGNSGIGVSRHRGGLGLAAFSDPIARLPGRRGREEVSVKALAHPSTDRWSCGAQGALEWCPARFCVNSV